MSRLDISERAFNFLESLPSKFRKQVTRRMEQLRHNPHPPSSNRLVNLTSDQAEPLFRERSGDYRIIYGVHTNPDIVKILHIGHRSKVYRTIKKK